MSLAQKNELKLIHTNHHGITILDAGPNPANARKSIDSITMHCNTNNIDHLLSADFNTTATQPNSHSKLQQLQALQAKQAAEESKQQATATQNNSSSSGSSTPPTTPTAPWPPTPGRATTVKHEYAPLQYTDDHDSIVTYTSTGAINTSIANSSHYFSDPLNTSNPGAAEPPEARQARLKLWSFIKATCYHHPHLLTGLRIGDIYGVMKQIMTYGLSHSTQDTLDAISALTKLTKKGTSWHDFVTAVTQIRNALDRETDDGWKIGNKLLPAYTLQAIEGESRFEVELTLLRRTQPPPTIDHILATLGAKARTFKTQNSVSGHVAATTNTSDSSKTTSGGLEICRNFKNYGKCRFERPNFGRWCNKSHGTPAVDKQRAADRAAYKANNPTLPNQKHQSTSNPGPKQKPTPPPATDACYRCGSKNHGIDDCTEDVRGHIAAVPPGGAAPGIYNAPPPPPPPHSGSFDDIANAVADVLQKRQLDDKVTGLVGAPASSPSHDLDHELAKLFHTRT